MILRNVCKQRIKMLSVVIEKKSDSWKEKEVQWSVRRVLFDSYEVWHVCKEEEEKRKIKGFVKKTVFLVFVKCNKTNNVRYIE